MTGTAVHHYRADIDGLRGIAIIPVMLFHLRVPGFTGGFVGVDTFFVISGYLITSLIHKEILGSTFSFARFYERRIRRLFPALFVMMTVVSIVAIALLLPRDLKAFSNSVGATAAFASNVYFWLTAGYFDAPAEFKPLLHCWSLAVEEQFYIFFPLSLLVLQRCWPRRIIPAVALVCLASFIASVLTVTHAPDDAFYLPMWRAWELFLGVLLALGAIPALGARWQRESAAVLGILLIACGAHFLSKASVFPGFAALLPTLGTALIIHAGSSGSSATGRVLAWRPFVFVGLISYPLYLWHWPIIVFTKYYLVRELTPFEKVGLFSGSFLLAIISWRFVERPFRAAPHLFSRQKLFAVASVVSVFFIGLGLTGNVTQGLPSRLPGDVAQLDSASDLKPQLSWVDRHGQKPLFGQACQLGIEGPPRFLLWGDSEAIPLAPVIDQEAKKLGLAGILVARLGCPPLFGIERYDVGRHRRAKRQVRGRGCGDFSNQVVLLLDQHPEINRVILVGRWALHSLGSRYGDEYRPPAVISRAGIQDNSRVFRTALADTFRYLNEHGRQVVFIAQPPEIGWDVPSVLARARWFGRVPPAAPSLSAYARRQRVVTDCLDGLSRTYKIRQISVSGILCPSGTCSVEKNGIALYRDSYHLSPAGGLLLAPALQQALADF